MGLISRTADLYYTFRFLKLLVTPWEEMDAFKHGIIDKDGNVLRKSSELKTDAERTSYTTFHRLVFNLKKLLNKVPLGKTRIASYAAALYLLKEETGMSDEGIRRMLEKIEGVEFDLRIHENTWFLNDKGHLQPGTYSLRHNSPLLSTFEFRAHAGSKVDVVEATAPAGSILGIPVFHVKHRNTQQLICVTTEDITR
jgi:hypothetical protein